MPNAVFFEIEREDRQGAVAQQQSSSTRSTDRRYSLKVLETRRDRKLFISTAGETDAAEYFRSSCLCRATNFGEPCTGAPVRQPTVRRPPSRFP
jgi:hypothetical protein